MNETEKESDQTTSKHRTTRTREVDAYESPTEIFQWINFGRWDKAVKRTKTCPSEASVWIISRKDNGDLKWKYLPLHLVCLQPNPPKSIIKALIKAYPKGARCRDYDGNLPIHYLCAEGCNNGDVLETLIAAYPESLHQKDKYGRNPLKIVDQDESIDKIDSDTRRFMIEIVKRNQVKIQRVEIRDEAPVYEEDLDWQKYQLKENRGKQGFQNDDINANPNLLRGCNHSPKKNEAWMASEVEKHSHVKRNKNNDYVMELEGMVTRKEHRIDELEAKLELKNQVKARKSLHMEKHYEDEIERQRTELKRMELLNVENQWKYEKRITELESCVQVKNNHEQNVLNLQSRYDNEIKEKRELCEKLSMTMSEIYNIKKSRSDESSQAKETIFKLEEDISQMRDFSESLEVKLNVATQSENCAHDLESQLTLCRNEIGSLKRKLKNKSEENSEYEMKLGEGKVVTQEVITLRDKVKTLTKESNKYQRQLSELEKALMSSRVKSSDLDGRIEEIRIASSNKDKRFDTFQTSLSEKDFEIQSYKTKVVCLEASLEETKTRSTAMEGTIHAMKDLQQKTQEKERSKHADYSIKLSRLNELDKTLKSSMVEITSLKIKIDSNKREIASYREKFQEQKLKHDKERSGLCKQLDVHSSKAAALREKIIKLNDDNCAYKRKINEQRTDFDSKLLAVKNAVSLQANAFATLQEHVSNSDDLSISSTPTAEGGRKMKHTMLALMPTPSSSHGGYESFDLEDQVRDLTSEKYALETELENLTDKVQAYKQDNFSLKARIEYLGGKQHELNSMIAMMEELKEKDSNQSRKIRELASNNTELEKDCILLSERVKKLSESEQAEKETVKKLSESVQAGKETVKKLSESVQAEKEKVKKLSESEQVEKEKVKKLSESEQAEKEKVKKLSESEKVEKEKVKKLSESEQAEKEKVKKISGREQAERENVQKELATISISQEKIKELKDLVANNSTSYQNQVNNLTETQHMQLQEIDAIKRELQTVNDVKDSYKRRLQEGNTGNEQLGQKAQKMRTQVKELMRRNEAYQEQIQNLISVNRPLEHSAQRLQDEVNNLKMRNESLVGQIGTLDEKLNSLADLSPKTRSGDEQDSNHAHEEKWEKRAGELQHLANDLMRQNNEYESKIKELSNEEEKPSLANRYSTLYAVTGVDTNQSIEYIEQLKKEIRELTKINAALLENLQDLTRKFSVYKKKVHLHLKSQQIVNGVGPGSRSQSASGRL